MRFLLDTHTLLWYLSNDAVLPPRVRELIDQADEVGVSIASFWEITVKCSLGKLKIESSITDLMDLCRDKLIDIWPITADHLETLSRLPLEHRDPFDRLLVSQAISEAATIITRDKIIPLYPVQTQW